MNETELPSTFIIIMICSVYYCHIAKYLELHFICDEHMLKIQYNQN